MKINRQYMKNDEFKTRQLWLPFAEPLEAIIEVLCHIRATAEKTWKAWRKSFITTTPQPAKPHQMQLPVKM